MSVDETRPPSAVVHLELHTGDPGRAGDFLSGLLGWRPERVATSAGPYTVLGLGCSLSGGMVECGLDRPRWLPYVEISEIVTVTEAAVDLGARVVIEPREGPYGWRSVVTSPDGTAVALWEPHRRPLPPGTDA